MSLLEESVRREFAALFLDQPELLQVLELSDKDFRMWVLLVLAVQQRHTRIARERNF